MDVIGNVNMKLLQTFLVVAERGSFRVAAEVLNRSHSAISAQIMQLEAQLDVALFQRTTRSVKLTEEGEYLRESASKALYEINLGLRRIREVNDTRRGQLSLASSSNLASLYLPPILTEFVRDYPEIAVTIRELTSRDLYQAVRKKEVDFAIGPQEEDNAFDYTTILVESLYALVPPRFVDGPRETITLEELADLPTLLSSPATSMRKLVDGAMHARGLPVPRSYQFIQAETIIAMAEAGLGVAIQPESRLVKVDRQRVRVLRLVDPPMTRKMALIVLRHQKLSPAARRFASKIIRDVRAMTGFDDAPVEAAY